MRRTRVRRRRGKKTRKQRGGALPTKPSSKITTGVRGPAQIMLKQSQKPVTPNYTKLFKENFAAEMETMPIYIINTHGSICVSYEECEKLPPGSKRPYPRFDTDRYPIKFPEEFPVFEIPDSTYILNLTSGGEYCIALSDLTQTMIDIKKDIRNFFLIDSKYDTIPRYPRTSYPLLTACQRASHILYPNMMFSLNDADDQTGVFNLSDMTNFDAQKRDRRFVAIRDTHRLRHWYLKDVIDEIYRLNPLSPRRGIFIIAACSSAARAQEDISIPCAGLDLASSMIRLADLTYSSQKPVSSRLELGPNTPEDIGYGTPPNVPAIETLACMAISLGTTGEEYNENDPTLFHDPSQKQIVLDLVYDRAKKNHMTD